jgi:hypothetical protein
VVLWSWALCFLLAEQEHGRKLLRVLQMHVREKNRNNWNGYNNFYVLGLLAFNCALQSVEKRFIFRKILIFRYLDNYFRGLVASFAMHEKIKFSLAFQTAARRLFFLR